MNRQGFEWKLTWYSYTELGSFLRPSCWFEKKTRRALYYPVWKKDISGHEILGRERKSFNHERKISWPRCNVTAEILCRKLSDSVQWIIAMIRKRKITWRVRNYRRENSRKRVSEAHTREVEKAGGKDFTRRAKKWGKTTGFLRGNADLKDNWTKQTPMWRQLENCYYWKQCKETNIIIIIIIFAMTWRKCEEIRISNQKD